MDDDRVHGDLWLFPERNRPWRFCGFECCLPTDLPQQQQQEQHYSNLGKSSVATKKVAWSTSSNDDDNVDAFDKYTGDDELTAAVTEEAEETTGTTVEDETSPAAHLPLFPIDARHSNTINNKKGYSSKEEEEEDAFHDADQELSAMPLASSSATTPTRPNTTHNFSLAMASSQQFTQEMWNAILVLFSLHALFHTIWPTPLPPPTTTARRTNQRDTPAAAANTCASPNPEPGDQGHEYR